MEVFHSDIMKRIEEELLRHSSEIENASYVIESRSYPITSGHSGGNSSSSNSGGGGSASGQSKAVSNVRLTGYNSTE